MTALVPVLLAVLIVAAIVLAAVFHSFVESLKSTAQSMRTQVGALSSEIAKARTSFGPTQNVPCKHCNGTGRVVRDNPLVSAIADAIEYGTKKR